MSWVFKPASVIILLLCLSPDLGAEQRGKDDWFSSDKYKHFAVSTFCGAGVPIVSNKHFDVREERSLAIGFGVTMTLGGIKEIKDYHSKGETASFKDLAWDLAGALTGILAASLIL